MNLGLPGAQKNGVAPSLQKWGPFSCRQIEGTRRRKKCPEFTEPGATAYALAGGVTIRKHATVVPK